ncbi:ABC transporter permease subunit [Alicyclobacillus sp. SO9]|uniref:ABC transporter permease subunit n=1 Tax=Alicyclobacillus sp. SO9 TaxID=2665646 RepID=UPI0018E86559|nr:ABC transporter permease subunit [Alicyclobacillus sp. SO9]QQE79850.1 ABC transporter permease subunit [Alicyclobacillus sp. SO9]
MNISLYKATLRMNLSSTLSYGIGTILYLWILIWAYPYVSSPAMNKILDSMPQSVLKAFGAEGGVQNLGVFLAEKFYGLILLLILAIFTISVATKLVSGLADRGSLAYLLATPVSRTRLAITQIGVTLTTLWSVCLLAVVGGIAGAAWFAPHNPLDSARFIQMNLMVALLFSVIAAYSFVFSCIFDNERRARAASTVITLIFYVLDLLAKLTDKVAWLKHFSVFALYSPANILRGKGAVTWSAIGLAAATVLVFILAVAIFRRRQYSF